jgi:hypothetical protein
MVTNEKRMPAGTTSPDIVLEVLVNVKGRAKGTKGMSTEPRR